ncbi:hypothetical protein AGR4C_Lc80060 [Agrobacterium tumefaciens str. Kerr 14]|uniref:Uncharacterized protein n=1 Tax=Agrobacterium tumefaciens str. Kerr 14 TaxID=1183424 RepID=A0A1S7S3Y1_AGRTU|nr:hypothetical protein AGR4C_Lc80060 [Agrobacterium tumefaciens str. Kerr 14]
MKVIGGAKRDRTADLLHAMQALSQLSYSPIRVPAFLPVPGTEAVVVPFGGGLLLRLSDECKHKKRPGVIFLSSGRIIE